MKTRANREKRIGAVESEQHNAIEALFSDVPELAGFSVEFQAEVVLSHVGLHPEPPRADALLIHEQIRNAVLEMMEQWPDTPLFRGARTFARTIH